MSPTLKRLGLPTLLVVVGLGLSSCGGGPLWTEDFNRAEIYQIAIALPYWDFASQHDGLMRSQYGVYDWSTDECSVPFVGSLANSGPGFNFTWPCIQHDFGYRNFKWLESAYAPRWGSYWRGYKDTIDSHFWWNMIQRCDNGAFYWIDTCQAVANTYWWAVHNFG